MNRREFLGMSAAAGASAMLSGCKSLLGETSFYGPTIRDRLWMWGHHIDCAPYSAACADKKQKSFVWPGKSVDMAEGCRLMGIPNNCVIRWCNKPEHPWGNYFDQFKGMRRITFGLTDAGNGTVWDKLRWACEELKPQVPNLTGGFLDDYFCGNLFRMTDTDFMRVADTLHAHDLRLSVVLYADSNGFKPEYRKQLMLCDETSLWFWKSSNIQTMLDNVRRCREFIGPDKSLLLGLYMWDFSVAEPVSEERMALQLRYAQQFLEDGTVTGLIFHPSYMAALDVPAIRLSKAWIAAHGEDLWAKNRI